MELFALVIDANTQERRVLQDVLSSQRWKVTEAASIDEAIEGINRHGWKLVFCDAHLSTHRIDSTGELTLLRELKRRCDPST
ncbi:MAG: response regulator [Acidobacteria bacterium]|nr:response regulator [Acidobacteriota bacterium]